MVCRIGDFADLLDLPISQDVIFYPIGIPFPGYPARVRVHSTSFRFVYTNIGRWFDNWVPLEVEGGQKLDICQQFI